MDLVEIARIRRILEEPHGDRFVERVLTPEERELAKSRAGRLAEFVAGRFAAKEAVAKALGCGIGRQVGLQDIRVLPERGGKPVCCVSGAAWARLGLADAVGDGTGAGGAVGAAGDGAKATAAGVKASRSGDVEAEQEQPTVAETAAELGWVAPSAIRLQLTITHTETTAAAFAIAERD